jgi:hypothetical protein
MPIFMFLKKPAYQIIHLYKKTLMKGKIYYNSLDFRIAPLISHETSDMVDNHKIISEYPNNLSLLMRNAEIGFFRSHQI